MSFSYEYFFVNKGKTRDEHLSINNEIWLDVGGYIEEGTFDHHNCEKGYISTVDVLTHEIDLVEQTMQKLDPSQTVRIYLHINPDVDALFATYYLKFFLENGREAFEKRFVTSNLGQIITKYVNDIDSGRRKNIEGATLYNLVCHLNADSVKSYLNVTNQIELSNKMMEEALGWIEYAVNSVEANPRFNLYDWNLPFDEEDTIANKIVESVGREGKYNYERDKKEGRLVIKDISIWTKDGTIETVKAAIWKEIPLSPSSAYIYARNEGAVVTFVPHNDYGNYAARVSINPNISHAVDKYSLMEVAEIYEQIEQIHDRKQLSAIGTLRRDYSRPRGDDRSRIFLDRPFSMSADPWYVSDKGDMVDAPGSGSLIPIDVMIEILENITKMVKKTYIVYFELTSKIKPQTEVTTKKKTQESLPAWTKDMKKILSETGDSIYPLVIAEIDASLISHNYDILDAYFMSISDGAYVDAKDRNVFRLDYRTHLYVNQANAVLFIATSNETSNIMQMNGLLDWTTDETVRNSSIVDMFAKILYQREKFKELGRFLGSFKENEKKIKKKNEELIELLAKAQADECIDSQVELDAFAFLYEALHVPELRESVKETMTMVSEYSKERVYANLNFLSLITIPFILISTLFQVGLIKFEPLLDLQETYIPVAIPWIVSLAVIVLITMILYFARRKK